MHGKLLFGKIVAMPDSRWKLISIRTLCEEGEPRRKSRSNLWSIFLSTPSARRATIEEQLLREVEGISIHALCEEGDNTRPAEIMPWAYFYPRPPRGGRRVHRRVYGGLEGISIHALREEGDVRSTA